LFTGVAEDASVLLAGEAADRGVRSKSRQSSYRLNELTKYLDLAFKAREAGHSASFRLRVGADESRGSKGAYQKGTNKPGTFGAGHGTGPTLSFWCFSPGVAMSDLKRRGVKSVVLTSGTLSPMTSFASELGLNFKVRLENPHVIDPGQVWGGVVPVGPSGKRLNSTYRFRDTDEYKSELGNVIVNCARIVPDGEFILTTVWAIRMTDVVFCLQECWFFFHPTESCVRAWSTGATRVILPSGTACAPVNTRWLNRRARKSSARRSKSSTTLWK
jgi:regulator of telomere elongation helicase 1